MGFTQRKHGISMTTIRRFTCDDLFTFNDVNMDVLTETVRSLSNPAALQSTHARGMGRLQGKGR